jgi:hypothetical protein
VVVSVVFGVEERYSLTQRKDTRHTNILGLIVLVIVAIIYHVRQLLLLLLLGILLFPNDDRFGRDYTNRLVHFPQALPLSLLFGTIPKRVTTIVDGMGVAGVINQECCLCVVLVCVENGKSSCDTITTTCSSSTYLISTSTL